MIALTAKLFIRAGDATLMPAVAAVAPELARAIYRKLEPFYFHNHGAWLRWAYAPMMKNAFFAYPSVLLKKLTSMESRSG